jgi:Kef-type K+ transport system membrane component KefB
MVVLSALNTLYAVLVFKLITAWFDLDLRGDWVGSIAQPLFTFGGSWLLAWGLYRLIAWSLRTFDLQDENTVLLLLGLLLLGLTAARMLGLSTLLVPLLAGVLLRNATPRPCIWPRHFGTAGGALVLLLFVVLGGVWSPSALVAGAGAALAVLAVRTLAKAGTLVLTARWSGIELRQALALALTLTPVSATTLVLLADLHAVHPEVAARLAPMVLSAIAIMAVLGPLAAAGGLRLAGEHQRPDAPARARPAKESP